MKLLSTLLLSSLLATGIQAQEFTAVSGPISEEIKGVILPANCGLDNGKSVPKTMYTIVPASGDTVSILTSPPDLVTATVQAGKVLSVTFNQNVAPTAAEGGVKIQIPDAQFQELTAQASAHVQVQSGFTSLANIGVTSSASVRAIVGSNGSGVPLTVSVSSSATLDVQFDGGEIERAGVSSSGTLNVAAATVKAVDISSSGSAQIRVDNPIGSGSVSSSGRLTVSANGSCDNLEINSSGSCQDGQDVGVTVSVGEPYIQSGTATCGGSFQVSYSSAFSFGATGKFLAVAAGLGAWLVTLL